MAACLPASGRPPEPSPRMVSRADLDAGRRLAAVEGLQVGVDGDEIDALDPGRDHPVEGVAAAPADADDPDLGPDAFLHQVESELARDSAFMRPPSLP